MKTRSLTQLLCSLWVLLFWWAGVEFLITTTGGSEERRFEELRAVIPIFSVPLVVLLIVFLRYPRERFVGAGGALGCVVLGAASYGLFGAYFPVPNRDTAWDGVLIILGLYVGCAISLLVAMRRRG